MKNTNTQNKTNNTIQI